MRNGLLGVWGWLHVLFSSQQYRQGDGCADERRDGVDGQRPLEARHAGYEVAEQRQGSTAEDVCRQKDVVVGGVEQSAADVRHGKAEKHDRAAVGGDDGGQCACRGDGEHACPSDVETEVGGVHVAEQQDVERLGKQHDQGEDDGGESHEDIHLSARDP